MRIGTMTSTFREKREGGAHYSYIESVQHCAKAGFEVLDMNLCALPRRQTELHLDDWQTQTEKIRNEAERLNIPFVQSHPPYRPGRSGQFETEEQEKFFCDMEARSIEISAMLGVKWAVIHPVTDISADMGDTEAQARFNLRSFDRIINLADKLNVGLAFENMFDAPFQPRRFGTTAQDLLSIVSACHSEKVGVCWDTGHANRAYGDQTAPIQLLGDNIKALHIDDNQGKDDLHMLPFMGDICWEKVMHSLYTSGCKADMIYEIRTNINMPEALRDLTVHYCKEVGDYLITLYK